MGHTRIVSADLDSPRRELSYGGLGIIAALLVRCGIDFSCVYTELPIQQYMFDRGSITNLAPISNTP